MILTLWRGIAGVKVLLNSTDNRGNLRFFSLRNENSKLVPTQPRKNIGLPKGVSQHVGSVHQSPVSSKVAQCVIDGLQTVKVNKGDGKRFTGSIRELHTMVGDGKE